MKKLLGLGFGLIVSGAFFFAFLPGVFKSKKLFEKSELIGKPPPNFEVENIVIRGGIIDTSTESSKARKTLHDVIAEAEKEGKAVLINFFASWCKECAEEKTEFLRFKKIAKIVGVVFQDKKENIIRYLEDTNPYDYIFFDNGETAIEYGITGVPETFVVKDGKIIKKFLGRFSPEELVRTLKNYESSVGVVR